MVDEKTAVEDIEETQTEEEPNEIEELKERMVNLAKDEVGSKEPADKKEEKKEEPAPKDEEPEDDIEDSVEADGDDSQDEVSLDDALVERAIRSGISYSKLTSLAGKLTPEELEEIVGLAEKKTADAEKPTDEVSQEDKTKKEVEELMSKIPDIDDEWEDDVKSTFGGLKDVIRSQAEAMAELKSTIAEIKAGSQQSSESLFIDGKIEALGKPYEEIFGKGPTSMLSDRASKTNREKLGRYLKFVNDEATEAGESISAEESFERALSGAFNSHVSKVKGAEAARKSKARSKNSISAPKNTGGKFVDEQLTPITEGDTTDQAFAAMKQALKQTQTA